jgi:hypothetical protein
MSLTLDGTATARAASGVAGLHWLIEFDFSGGTQYFTTWSDTVTIAGHDYIGRGNLLSVSNVLESEDPAADKLTFALNAVNSALIALVLGPVTTYRNRPVRLYGQFFDDTFKPAGAPVLRWQGYMDKVQIPRTPSPPEGGPSSGRIELQCVRAGQARFRNATGLRLTDAQQQQRFPGDLGLQYVQTLVEQPSLWLSKRFQTI